MGRKGIFWSLISLFVTITGIGVPMIWPNQHIIGITLFVIGLVGIFGTVIWRFRWKQMSTSPESKYSTPALHVELDLHDFLQRFGVNPMELHSTPNENLAAAALRGLRQFARDGELEIRGQPGNDEDNPEYTSFMPREFISPNEWRWRNIWHTDVIGVDNPQKIPTRADGEEGFRFEGMGFKPVECYRDLTITEASLKRCQDGLRSYINKELGT